MEENQGYVIRQSVLFDNSRGFALGEHPREGFVTWQFTQEGSRRDYYWGHYYDDGGGYRPAETEQTRSGCSVSAGAQGVWGRYFPIASARTQQPPAGRTAPERCISAPLRTDFSLWGRFFAPFPPFPLLPADGKGQSETP